MKPTAILLKFSILVLLSLFVSCERLGADNEIPVEKAPTTKSVVINASIEQQHSGEAQTKTVLGEGNSVLWSAGDAISVLQEPSSGLTLLKYSDITGMSTGSSKGVVITSVAYNGYTLGSTGTSWETTAVSGFSSYGTSLSSSQASANETSLLQKMNDYYGSNKTKATFTLKKTSSSSYTLQNSSGYYLSGTGTGSGSASWSSSQMSLSIENATGTSASSPVVSQSNNSSLLRIRNSSSYPLYTSATPYWNSGETGGWTLWYVYEAPSNSNNKFTSNASSASASAEFSGTVTEGSDKLYSLYPYNEGNTLLGGEIHFSVPSVQSYKENSFDNGANPAVGVLENNSVSLKNLFGILKITLKSDDAIAVNSIKITDKNYLVNLWGDVTLPTSSVDDGTYSYQISGGNNSITMDCGNVTLPIDGRAFYFVVPVGSFEGGFKIEVETTGGHFEKSTTKANTITRSTIKAMPSIRISEDDLESDPFLIENDIVHDFMENASYGTTVDFSYSAFGNGGYGSRSTSAYSSGIRTDFPAVKTVYWTGSASSYTVTVTDKADYTYTETVSGNSYDISGLAPNVKYYYTVSDGSEIVTSGSFRTSGQLRMIRIDETWNVRDLGGWHTYSGKTVKYGKLFRGGHLDYIETVSQNKLVSAGVKAELDLRGIKSEGGKDYGDGSYAHDNEQSLIPDATYKHYYIDYSRDNPGLASGLVQCVSWAIQQSLAGRPVYFHCKTGADRTGQISVLLLGLLGVTEQDIEKEYEMTNFGYESGSRIDRTLPNTYMNYLVPVINACTGDTFQARCRYYLKDKFEDASISDEDMDAFINLMLE